MLGVQHADVALQIGRSVQRLVHELLDVLRGNPRRAEAHFNLAGFQVFRLRFGQRVHIGLICRVLLRRPLCLSQLPAHISRKVLIGADIAVRAGDAEDNAAQVSDDFIFRLAGELGHVGQVYSGFLTDGYGEGFFGGVHMRNRRMLFNRPLGENIRLALELVVIVQHLQ